jgi:hypothetical protein
MRTSAGLVLSIHAFSCWHAPCKFLPGQESFAHDGAKDSMTVEGSLSSASSMLAALYSDEPGGMLALKVIKEQMDQQQRLISSLTQSSQVAASAAYDGSGRLLGNPLHHSVDTRA